MAINRNDATRLLAAIGGGDSSAAAQLLPLVYDELHCLAAELFRDQPRDHTLQATALVHEAYLRMVGQDDAYWTDRRQFFTVAATAMRRILIDHARARRAQKRGREFQRIALHESSIAVLGSDEPDELDLDQALSRLAALDSRKGQVVELRFFCGLSNEDVAHVLGVSRATVAEDWRFARAWLAAEMEKEGTAARRHEGAKGEEE